jgi:ABC-type Zn uptake system ZnuABC Zn-binding protein ZnuA
MSMKDIEKMKKLLEEKKAKAGFLQAEKKIGSGRVEKMNKNIGIEFTRTHKISQ